MTTHPIKIGIPGAGGRMGGMIIREMALRDDMVLVAATDRPDSDFIGQDSGVLAGIGSNGVTTGLDKSVHRVQDNCSKTAHQGNMSTYAAAHFLFQ